MKELLDFAMFLSMWNRVQGQQTPRLHFTMADWLEDAWQNGDTRLLLQVFRSGGKSTVAGLFSAWLLYRQPELRILVLAADLNLARKMVRQVRRIIERHPLTGGLQPKRADEWGADRFTVRRKLELRDPSMLAKGITANVTGTRADIIICDDVEVPNTCDTGEKRRDLRERLAEIDFVLVPGGTQLYIGTPHSWHTIYAEEARRESGEDAPFLDGFHRLKIPVLDDGRSAWPERFSEAAVAQIRRSAGPNRFSSQMMLEPVNSADGRIDPAQLVFYADPLQESAELRGLFLGGKRLASCSAWWDPAFGNGGDASVLAVVFTDEDGGYWLHNVTYITGMEGVANKAEFQCRAVAQAARQFHVPSIAVEINGVGRFLPEILRQELARARAPCAVLEVTSRRPKDIRIMEAFDALLAARALNVHDDVRETPFIAEMREWRPGRSGGRDDGLDAVAGALSLAPVRLRGDRFAGRQEWQGASKTFEALADFEV